MTTGVGAMRFVRSARYSRRRELPYQREKVKLRHALLFVWHGVTKQKARG